MVGIGWSENGCVATCTEHYLHMVLTFIWYYFFLFLIRRLVSNLCILFRNQGLKSLEVDWRVQNPRWLSSSGKFPHPAHKVSICDLFKGNACAWLAGRLLWRGGWTTPEETTQQSWKRSGSMVDRTAAFLSWERSPYVDSCIHGHTHQQFNISVQIIWSYCK